MSGPDVEQTAETAAALGEEDVILALHAYGRRIGYSQTERMRDAVEALNPRISLLVAAAEERGAAKERERIAAAIEPTMREASLDARTWGRRPEPAARVQEASCASVAATCRTVLRIVAGEQVLGIPRAASS